MLPHQGALSWRTIQLGGSLRANMVQEVPQLPRRLADRHLIHRARRRNLQHHRRPGAVGNSASPPGLRSGELAGHALLICTPLLERVRQRLSGPDPTAD